MFRSVIDVSVGLSTTGVALRKLPSTAVGHERGTFRFRGSLGIRRSFQGVEETQRRHPGARHVEICSLRGRKVWSPSRFLKMPGRYLEILLKYRAFRYGL